MTDIAIVDELKSIKQDLTFIKEHMVDIDSILTEEDFEALKSYRKEKKQNKLTSHEQLMKELNL